MDLDQKAYVIALTVVGAIAVTALILLVVRSFEAPLPSDAPGVTGMEGPQGPEGPEGPVGPTGPTGGIITAEDNTGPFGYTLGANHFKPPTSITFRRQNNSLVLLTFEGTVGTADIEHPTKPTVETWVDITNPLPAGWVPAHACAGAAWNTTSNGHGTLHVTPTKLEIYTYGVDNDTVIGSVSYHI